MSAADVADPVQSNAQAELDVQNMLKELKGGGDKSESAPAPETTVAEAAPPDPEARQNGEKLASNGTDAGVKEADTEAKAGSNSKKPEDDAVDEDRKRSDRPSRGGRGRGGGGGRGRGDHKSYKQNIKSDLTTQEETDDPVQIRKQVEFYFSDSNLPMDKFLLSQVSGSENLPVDLKIIHSFKRMRRFQPFSAIPAALKESKFLQVTDDDTKVKRKEPLPEKVDPKQIDRDSVKVFEDRAMPRSVYVKGFGEEDKDTQLDIEAFFSQYGPWNAVRLRRANDKLFKGSVFAEFETEEAQQKFLALDPKPKYKEDRDLQIMSKKNYCDKKVDDIKAGKIRPSNRGRGGGGHQQSKRKRDDEDDRDWRDRRDDDRRNGGRDSRRGGRDGGRRGRGGGHGRDIKKDARGVPIVEATEQKPAHDSLRAKREAATADALAQARAVVEAQTKEQADHAADAKTGADESGPAEVKAKTDTDTGADVKADAKAEMEGHGGAANANANTKVEPESRPGPQQLQQSASENISGKKRTRDELESGDGGAGAGVGAGAGKGEGETEGEAGGKGKAEDGGTPASKKRGGA